MRVPTDDPRNRSYAQGGAGGGASIRDAVKAEEARERSTKGKGSALAGRIHLISLDHVRQRLGGDWSRYQKMVHATADKLMRQYLAGQAIYETVDDMNYAVMFAGSDTERARAVCLLILREITRSLLGEDMALDQAAVRTIVAAADGTLSLPSDRAKTPERAVAEVAPSAATAAPPAGTVTTPLNLVPEDLDFLYRPMWDIKRAAITTYLCQAMSIDSGGEMLFDYDVLPGASQSSVVSELDLRAARRVLVDLEKIAASGRKVLVSTTVHCHTLEDRDTRQAYTETLSGLSDDARRLLVFEIVGLDATASESRMHTSLSAVKSFGRTTVARMPIDMTTLNAFQNNGFASVGVHLEQKSGDERRLMGLFEQFVTLANRVGLRTFVHGIRSSSQAMIAMGAGFDHVDGDVVALSADRIGAVMRFQLADLYGAAGYSDIP